jgi:HlyD family type I secretion membrane fusion protein
MTMKRVGYWNRSSPTQLCREAYMVPERPMLVGTVVIICFVAALLMWGSLAPVSGAAIANGHLQVEGKRQSVQHPYGGVIKELLVREGDVVAKGQTLLRLVDTEPRSRLEVLRAEYVGLKAQEARLIAERDGKVEPSFGPELTSNRTGSNERQAMDNERATMAARKLQFEAEIEALHKKIAQLHEEIAGTRALVSGIDRQHELLQEETNGARHLLAQGYTAKTRVMARGIAYDLK